MEPNNQPDHLQSPLQKYEGLCPGFYWAYSPDEGFYPVHVYSLSNRQDYDSLAVDISQFPQGSHHDRAIHPDNLPFGIVIKSRIPLPGEHEIHPAELSEFFQSEFDLMRDQTNGMNHLLLMQDIQLKFSNGLQRYILATLAFVLIALTYLALHR